MEFDLEGVLSRSPTGRGKEPCDGISDCRRIWLTLARIAGEVDLHPVYLSRTFRLYNSEGLGQFVNRLRVRFAQRKLWDRVIPIAEIALLSGFSDQSQFTRIFKRHTRMTPWIFEELQDPRFRWRVRRENA